MDQWLNQIHHMDALELCKALPAESVDMILADLPYAALSQKVAWDKAIISTDLMWPEFERVIKPRGAIVLTANFHFAMQLVSSNPALFRYEWVWEKENGHSGFMNANARPLLAHEYVLVFSKARGVSGAHQDKLMAYYPQKAKGAPYATKSRGQYEGYNLTSRISTKNDGDRHPRSVLRFAKVGMGALHPTQKPAELFAYLIKTYTQPGEVVLDPTCGVGTTAVAAKSTGRAFICSDTDAGYAEIARKRINASFGAAPKRDKPTLAYDELPIFAAGNPEQK